MYARFFWKRVIKSRDYFTYLIIYRNTYRHIVINKHCNKHILEQKKNTQLVTRGGNTSSAIPANRTGQKGMPGSCQERADMSFDLFKCLTDPDKVPCSKRRRMEDNRRVHKALDYQGSRSKSSNALMCYRQAQKKDFPETIQKLLFSTFSRFLQSPP